MTARAFIWIAPAITLTAFTVAACRPAADRAPGGDTAKTGAAKTTGPAAIVSDVQETVEKPHRLGTFIFHAHV